MKVLTFGEIMLRLSTPGHERFVQASGFEARFGGGEANVAVALAGFGVDSGFVSSLPSHEIGDAALGSLRRFGVDTRHIGRSAERIGIYYLESGAAQRASKVIYDRVGSAFSLARPEDFDWASILVGASWFHWTGITAALGENLRRMIRDACIEAHARGATVSCDLNYRKKLWTPAEARAGMIPLMDHVDVCIGNEEDAGPCLGIEPERSNAEAGVLHEEEYASLLARMRERFGFRAAAVTMRESESASRNGWSAMLLDDRDCAVPRRSRRYRIDVVDRVGAGDAFAAGLIRGLLYGGSTAEALEFAVAASCLKHSMPGDFLHASVGEVESLLRGGGAGRVQR
jgi:2-dehydro-3-deoxygluconokinase